MISRTDARSARGVCWIACVAALAGCGGGRGAAGSVTSAEAAAPTPTTTASVAPATAAAPPAGSAAPPADAASGPLASVSWLVGTWSGTSTEGATLEETWAAPAGTVMTGTSKLVGKDGKATNETMRIEARDGGAIVYVAQPGGAAPTEFTRDARTSGPTHAQFVNEQHDWPTRIRYERTGDELKVRLRGRTGQADESFALKPR